MYISANRHGEARQGSPKCTAYTENDACSLTTGAMLCHNILTTPMTYVHLYTPGLPPP